MSDNEIKLIEIFVMVVITCIGFIGGAIKFIINPYFNSKLEQIKKDNEIEISHIRGTIDIKIELEKLKSKNTEIYFQKQLEAMKELYKLRSKILPNYRMPDMDWDDACRDIAHNFSQIEEDIESYLTEYFSVLQKNIIDKLSNAKNSASEGKFENDPSDMKCYQFADNLWNRIEEANSELKEHIELQTHNKSPKENKVTLR